MMRSMDRHQPEAGGNARKPYAKPEIHQYALRAEEAVLGFCKTSGGAGPNIGDCDIPSACLSLGS